ncbi:alpha/beta fold hydrolase [Pseudoglutamicibacter albus]|uniref:alpha/beta fold hydrolase n=1 Tax=Pseudoglutamicibacter albus TaxID=98671 RepID=UPI00360E3CEB
MRAGDIDAFVAGFGPGLDHATALAFKANDPLALYAMFTEMETAEKTIPDTLIAQVSAPVLTMAGDKDPRRYADSQDEAQLAQNCTFHPLPGRNHAGTLFYAQDNLAVIKPFLDKNYPGLS